MVDLRIQYARTADGVNIAYAQFGEGVPLVYAPGAYGLALHYYSELAYSRGNVDALVAKGFRLIRYDSRGTGSSDRDNLDFSLDTGVLDMEAVVDRLGLDRFVLMGHFHSSRAAIAYTVRHPERVTHLVLRDPTTSRVDMDAIFPGNAVLDAMIPLAAEQWELVSLNVAAIGLGIVDLGITMELAKALRSGVTAESFVAQQKALAAIDVTDLLELVPVPTLVVVDKAFPGRSGDPAHQQWSIYVKKIAAAIPDSRLETTDDFPAAVAGLRHVYIWLRKSPPADCNK